MEGLRTPRMSRMRGAASSTDSGFVSSSGDAGANPQPGLTGGGGGGLQVMLKDVEEMVRLNPVSVPSGFTKLGFPIVYFPDCVAFSDILESDLHLLFKYYLSVVPRTEQQGFAMIVDRRSREWDSVRAVLSRVVTLFPARIREVYLLCHHADKAAATAQLVDEFLLDFEVVHVDDPEKLLHYIEAKCLPQELGGLQRSSAAVENWLALQQHVEGFSLSARRVARRLAHFVGMLNQEEVVSPTGGAEVQALKDAAHRNRGSYRKLRKELEELTDHGLLMLKSLQRPDANVMQRLAVQVLCKQLDQAWTYFNRSWKMQDHVYVQYLELNTFQIRFREVVNAFAEDLARLERDVPTGGFSSEDEVNDAVDKLDSLTQTAIAADVARARELEQMGSDLLRDHSFVSDCVQPKCGELRAACVRVERAVSVRREVLLKFLELFDALEALNKWCSTAAGHLERDSGGGGRHKMQLPMEESCGEESADAFFSQIRQLDYLLSKSRELKLRSRSDFEEDFEEIKDSMAAQTVFAVDDGLERLEAVTFRVMRRREELRARALRSEQKYNSLSSSGSPVDHHTATAASAADQGSESDKIRRENILAELIETEARYVSDLREVLVHYRDKLRVASDTSAAVFGNLEELHDFHAGVLYPELERCGANPAAVARAFVENCAELRALYSDQCRNMHSAHRAIDELGGEQNPTSVLRRCQSEAGHALPLSSYLLKPMQRLTKYQLMLKDLKESSNVVCGKADLGEALGELLAVIKSVNDSMVDLDAFVKGLPLAVKLGLGALCCRDGFQVITTESGGKGALVTPTPFFNRNKSQRRHVLLYDNHIVFCKQVSNNSEKNNGSGAAFHFKFSLATNGVGMSSVVKGEDKKLEVWVHGRPELYALEAKSKKAKEEFAAELRKVIIRQKEHRASNAGFPRSANRTVFYDTASSSTTASESDPAAAAALHGGGLHQRIRVTSSSRLSRSRSLDKGRHNAPPRSRSLDCGGERRSSPDEDEDIDDEEEAMSNGDNECNNKFIVLADYMALTSREIDLSEDEVVDVIKIGCAGWWYIKLSNYPYLEGWAPSTYLEKIEDLAPRN